MKAERRKTPPRTGKVGKRLFAVVVLALIAGGVAWFIAANRIDPLPDIGQISKIEFRQEHTEVEIPRDRWPDIVSTLVPAHREHRYNSLWAYLGVMTIKTRDGNVFELRLWDVDSHVRYTAVHQGNGMHCVGGDMARLKKILAEVASEKVPGKINLQ